jgi:hypothetical protein
MSPEVAHVAVGVVLFLFPIVTATLVALLVRMSRKSSAQDARIASQEIRLRRVEGLWDAKLFGARDTDHMRARALLRR